LTDKQIEDLKDKEMAKTMEKEKLKDYDKTVIVMKCIPGTNEILIYDDHYEYKISKKEIELNKDLFGTNQTTFLPGCSWVNFEGKLYISGGEVKGNPSNCFYAFDYQIEKFLRLKNLKSERCFHSSICDANFLYIIGGRKSNKCEKYDLKNQEFLALPDLKERERKQPILFIFQKTFLYCFFGLKDNEVFVDSIERLELRSTKSTWQIVPYKNSNNVDIYRTSCGVVDKEDKVIFVGGVYNNMPKKDIFYFDFKLNDFNYLEHENEEENCIFNDNKLLPLFDDYYGNFNKDMDFVKMKFE